HQVEVRGPAVVVLARRLARVAADDVACRRGEAVPDRLTAAVGGRRALDLERGGAGTPHERHDAHPLIAPCMIPPMICRPSNRKMRSNGRIETKHAVRMSE